MKNDNDAIPIATLTRVVVDNPYEIRRWCQRLICTEAQLRAAVARVGSDPAAVRSEVRAADKRRR